MTKIKKIKKKKKVKKSLVKKVAGKKVSIKKKKTKVDKKAENPPLRIANSNKYTPEEKVEINQEYELKKRISAEKNRQLNQYSFVYYKKIEKQAFINE